MRRLANFFSRNRKREKGDGSIIFVILVAIAIMIAAQFYGVIAGTINKYLTVSDVPDAVTLLLGNGYAVAAAGGTFTGDVDADSVTATTLNAPTGRSATYVIAASDAPASVKAQADYVCDGTADQTEINIAIAAVPAYGGGVLLSGGQFNLTSAIVMNKAYVNLSGEGLSTELFLSNGSNCNLIDLSASLCTIEKMYLNGNKTNQASGSGIKITAPYRNRLLNLEVVLCKDYGIWAEAPGGNIFLENIYVLQTDNHGYYWNSVYGSNFQNCWATQCGGDGFYLKASESQFNQLYADQNDLTGIWFYSVTEVNATNISSFNNLQDDIVLQTVARSNFSNIVSIYNTATGKTGGQKSGLRMMGCDSVTIENFSIYNYPVAADPAIGILLAQYNGSTNCILRNGTVYSRDGDLYFIRPALLTGNDLAGIKLRGTIPVYYYDAADQEYVETNNKIRDNTNFINKGEVRTASGSLTGGAANAILFAWHNPEAQDIFIKKVIVNITTADADAANIDVGIADDATYTNGGTEFFNDLKGETVQVNDSLVTTEHTQTIWVLCQDSASATDGWVVAKILDNDGTSIVGSYYIEYCGK